MLPTPQDLDRVNRSYTSQYFRGCVGRLTPQDPLILFRLFYYLVNLRAKLHHDNRYKPEEQVAVYFKGTLKMVIISRARQNGLQLMARIT